MSDIDFEKADFGGASEKPSCIACQTPISGSYFTVNGRILCASCKGQVALRPNGFEPSAFVRALIFGGGVAALGSVAWYAITAATGYELGLVSIAIGIFVGKAVQRGAGFRSGLAYPLLAVALTYVSIVAAYAPAIVGAANKEGTASPVLIALVVLAAPFLAGASNIIGLIIIGFGLWEAWRYARVPPLDIAGPFELGA